MPYDPGLASRLEELLIDRRDMVEKKMFGGIGWMLAGNMCVGVYKEWLIIRVGPQFWEMIIQDTHVKAMDITGKPMKGWAMVAPEGLDADEALSRYVELAISFVSGLPGK